MSLELRIVGPRGVLCEERELDAVIARRREAGFEQGSEVVILPRHAPLLMQTCACDVRWRRGGHEDAVAVERGVLEVAHDVVTIVVTKQEHAASAGPPIS